MKQRPFVKVVLMAAVLMLLLPAVAFSRAKIPVGERDVIKLLHKTALKSMENIQISDVTTVSITSDIFSLCT